jgi:hypothetical protein
MTARWRAEMRTMFLATLIIVVAGLVYVIAVGLGHR